ncbi:hypothetical protein HYH03_017689 [Edaphochlamys debaryana]|uniref:Kinesin motor domain-containing protein n=1 Tax=Edaphochlamys debaryana TaxID=47281 RepID=A0A835XHG7_9CHLO|nr:hypothetical protein HYH03_017689 [Edaphochlamys debaryana]|eukprot:KAG2483435.1 hypothetical protein HYH03_017689 [Edaphochlamys debaryana]
MDSADVSDADSTPQAERRALDFFAKAKTAMKVPRPAAVLETLTTIKARRPLGTGESVKVFVRVKPVLPEDTAQGRVLEGLKVHEKGEKLEVSIPAKDGKEHTFADFNSVLVNATNQQVFESVGAVLMPQLLDGLNVSLMAYGQTGSGKTYTMFGSGEAGNQTHGLLQLALHHIDKQLPVGLATGGARLAAGVFEVYNEELWSLLDAGGVERKHLAKGMADFNNHRPRLVESVDEAICLVMEALQHRTQDATQRNTTSSRSHAFVRLRLEQAFAESTLFLVDLAGSESISQASSSSQEKETIFINTSLNALERVVNSLSNRSTHVPYRDSMLTKVLEKGLDPSTARVALVATVSPFACDSAISKSTLMFAQRAKNVRTYAQVNPAPKRPPPFCPEELHRQLQALQAINNKLKQQLADMEANAERQVHERQVAEMRSELKRQMELHAQLQATSQRQEAEAEEAVEAERIAHAGTKQRVQELAEELEHERSAHANTRSRLTEQHLACEELRAALGRAQEEARAAGRREAEARVAEGRLQELQLEAARQAGELAGARSLQEQLQAALRAAQEELALARDQNTALKGKLAAAEGDASARQHELEEQLLKLRAASATAAAAAAEEAKSLTQRAAGLQQQLEKSQHFSTRQGQQLAEAEQQLAETRRCLDRAVAAEEAGAAKLATVTAALALAESELEAARDRGSGAEAKLAADLAAAEAERQHLAAELEAARAAAEGQVEAVRSVQARAEEQLQAARRDAAAQLAEAAAQLQAAQAQARAASDAGDQLPALRQQLAEQAAAHATALAAAAQDARAAAEAAAAERLAPLQTEVERLAATRALNVEQLARQQAEAEALRAAKQAAEQAAADAAAEAGALRVAAREAAERAARLEAQLERDVAPRRDASRALQERLRLLEDENKGMKEAHRGQLELKDKLIRQLEQIQAKLEEQLRLQQSGHDTLPGLGAQADQAASSPYSTATAGRSELGASPGPVASEADGTPGTHAQPHRANQGMYLGNRTTTASAAALARNTKTSTASCFITPSGPGPVSGHAPGRLGASGYGSGTVPVTSLLSPPQAQAPHAQHAHHASPTADLVTPEGKGLGRACVEEEGLDGVSPLDTERVCEMVGAQERSRAADVHVRGAKPDELLSGASAFEGRP